MGTWGAMGPDHTLFFPSQVSLARALPALGGGPGPLSFHGINRRKMVVLPRIEHEESVSRKLGFLLLFF